MSCWPVMLACAVTGHSLVLMIGGMLLAIYEKRMFRYEPRRLLTGHLALAGCTLVMCFT